MIVLALLHLGVCVCVNVKDRKLRQCLKPMYLSCLTQRCIVTVKQVRAQSLLQVLIVRRVLYTHRHEPCSATSCWSNMLLPSGILNKWVHIYSHCGCAVKSKSVKAENTRFNTHPSQAHTHSDNFCIFVWRNVNKLVAPKIKNKNPEYGWKRVSFQQGFKTKKKEQKTVA